MVESRSIVAALLSSAAGWVEMDVPHASAVMLPDGRVFARTCDAEGRFSDISTVIVVGDDLSIWHADEASDVEDRAQPMPEFTRRHAQAF